MAVVATWQRVRRLNVYRWQWHRHEPGPPGAECGKMAENARMQRVEQCLTFVRVAAMWLTMHRFFENGTSIAGSLIVHMVIMDSFAPPFLVLHSFEKSIKFADAASMAPECVSDTTKRCFYFRSFFRWLARRPSVLAVCMSRNYGRATLICTNCSKHGGTQCAVVI